MLTCNRNNRESEGKYIAACLEEIKQELRQVCTVVSPRADLEIINS